MKRVLAFTTEGRSDRESRYRLQTGARGVASFPAPSPPLVLPDYMCDPATFESCREVALACVREGEFDTAIPCFLKALEFDSKHVATIVDLASAYYHVNNVAAAKAMLLSALETDAKYPQAWHDLGIIYAREEKNIPFAKRGFKAATLYDPAYALAYHNLGLMFMQEGSFAEAKEYMEKALTLNSDAEWKPRAMADIRFCRQKISPITSAGAPMPVRR